MTGSEKAPRKSGKLEKVRKKHPDSFGARFGLLIYRCRIEQNLSQTELAIKLFNDEGRKGDISDLENGFVRKPWAKTIARYADKLDIPQEDIDACYAPSTQTGAYTREEHEQKLDRAEIRLRSELERAGADRGKLEQQLAEVQHRHADIEADFARTQAELEEARALLNQYDNRFEHERIDLARRALDRGDKSIANALFQEAKANMLAQAAEFQAEAAKLAHQQAKIADDDLRWADAEKLLTEAADLARTNIRYWIECGRARRRLGLFPPALAAIQTARSLAKAQGDVRLEMVASSEVGDLLVINGEHGEAEELYIKVSDMMRTRADQLQTPDALRDLSVSLNRVGDAATTRGDHTAAAKAYDESLDVRRKLAEQLQTPDALRDLSVSLTRVAKVALAAGDTARAVIAYGEDLKIARTLADTLQTPESRRDLAVSLYTSIQMSLQADDIPAARTYYAEAQTLIPTLHDLHIEEVRAAFARFDAALAE